MLLRSLKPGNHSNSSGSGKQSTADAEGPSVTVQKHEGLGDSVWRSHERMTGLDDK